MYRYLYRLSGGEAALAEDLTQETFLTAVRRFKDGRADEVTAQWLMGVARHKLLEHHRRAGREAATATAGLLDDPATTPWNLIGEVRCTNRPSRC